MGGDLLRGRTGAGQQARGCRVACGALAREEVLVYRRLDDRMHERELALRGEHVGAYEQVGHAPRLVGTQAGGARRERQVAGAAQDRDGARQLGGRRAEPLEPLQHEAPDRGWTHRLDSGGPVAARLDLRGVEGSGELAQEQRIAAGRLMAGCAERPVDLGAEPAAQQLRHRRLGERLRAQDLGGRVAGELAPELLAAGVGGTRRGKQQHGQALEPAREVAEELHGRGVGPVCVVHSQHQRSAVGQVDGQPIQPVESAEGGIGALRDDLWAGFAHEPPGQPGRPRQQGAALPFARQVDGLLEELARDPEREVALARSAAGFEHAQARFARQRPAACHQAALADARRSLDEHTAARALMRSLDGAAKRVELRLALEQMGYRGGLAPHGSGKACDPIVRHRRRRGRALA